MALPEMITSEYTDADRAWIAMEYLSGRSQKDIGFDLNLSPAAICIQIATFLRTWSGKRNLDYIYNEKRRMLCEPALRHYFLKTEGNITRPDSRESFVYRGGLYDSFAAFSRARYEHAWLMRAEGETYRQIGERLGVSRSRAQQMIWRFGRKVKVATRATKWSVQ